MAKHIAIVTLVLFVGSAKSNEETSVRLANCAEWPKAYLASSSDSQVFATLNFPHVNPTLTPRIGEYSPILHMTIDVLDLEPSGVVWGKSISIRNRDASPSCLELGGRASAKVGFPAWSPGGKWIAYILKEGGEHQLWVSSADGRWTRKISKQPMNILVSGQISTMMSERSMRVPFAWSKDGTTLVFATSSVRTRSSPNERAEQMSSPRVLETRRDAHDSNDQQVVDNTIGAYLSEIVESDVGGDWEQRVLLEAAAYFHVEYWANADLLIGLVDDAGGERRKYYRVAARVKGKRVDPHLNRGVLPVVTRDHIFQAGDSDMRTGVVLDCAHMHDIERQTTSRPVICIELNGGRLIDTDHVILQVDSGGIIRSFDKISGKLVMETSIRLPDHADFIPLLDVIRDLDGRAYLDEDGKIVLVSWLNDFGIIRSFRILLLDPLTGQQTLIKVDSTNSQRVVRFGPIVVDGSIVIEHALEAGRTWYSILDLETWQLHQLVPAMHSSSTFSEFDYDDLDYRRSDDVHLKARLILPNSDVHLREGGYPLVVWQYPQHANSRSEFHRKIDYFRARSYTKNNDLLDIGDWLSLTLLQQGFAVLHYPGFPLIGTDDDGGSGTFKDQMLMSAKAAVNAAVTTRKIDPDRVAIAGHSRGGSHAALMLAYSDLFRTGVSIAGGMNMMLMTHITQYDDRPFWDAPEAYIRNSASAQAPKINEPLLMIHGMADRSFARPAVSESLFYALQSEGGTARLVLVPFMGHEVRTESERLVVTQEVIDWLTHYLNSGALREQIADGVELEQPTIH